MKRTSGFQQSRIERIVNVYGDMLFRMCYIMLGNRADAEDAVQDTMIRCYQKAPDFESEAHERAWLIVTAKNRCRDVLRFRRRNLQACPVELPAEMSDDADGSILQALMAVPEKYRIVLELYYVEGYRTEDIARIIRRTTSAVKMRLKKGRRLLEEKYRKEYL